MTGRLTERSDKATTGGNGTDFEKKESNAGQLLQLAGTWVGDDLEDCLEEVYKTRGEATFQ